MGRKEKGMKSTMRKLLVSGAVLVLLFGGVQQAKADFVFVDQVQLFPYTWGIAFDGSTWHIGQFISTGWVNLDTNFVIQGSVGVSGTGAKRGLAYDSLTDTMFAVRRDTGTIYEIGLDGTVIQQFNTGFPFSLNGVATDPTDGTLWLAYFSGLIEHRARTGSLISSFSGGGSWTGIAFDHATDTLLALDTTDRLFEFRKDGTLLGQQDLAVAGNNGLGLEYLADSGKLYVTSQDGVLSIFEDSSLASFKVDIDIKPGSYPNSINPNAGGVISVAILTTADFDASTVDPETVQLEGAGARGKGKSGRYGSMEDVDGDGDLDLVVQIENVIEWDPDATEATLTGETNDGIAIQGTDSVNIVPPE
ncbi:MAG: hypothetical protein CEE38_02585 [Planctomycetes bacterium B3_Pla]|nr:MAG: hypothetical protein CEE38_02585 [Planctomycetes bacterium B3_Pla]